MHAIVAPAPKEGIFRVLVGPLKDSATQAQTRTDLEAAGFKNPIICKNINWRPILWFSSNLARLRFRACRNGCVRTPHTSRKFTCSRRNCVG